MTLPFYKYHGAGNDFILIDNRTHSFDNPNSELIRKMCNRRFGIGSDGLILLENTPQADFYMRYYNCDGMEASMCGNGGRCIVAFAKFLKIIKSTATFLAPDGIHKAKIHQDNVKLQMKDVTKIEHVGKDFYLNTGSPHYVKIIASHKDWDTVKEGRKIRYSPRFKEDGTNVNFLSFSDGALQLSTYERGVEDETYSCGTGTVAAAVIAGLLNNKMSQHITTKGGLLKVHYTKKGEVFKNIFLEGPTALVFEGKIRL